MSVVALAGRPNTGKTSLFNALTGRAQRIANFAGTTVEKAVGEIAIEGQTIQIVDLPGVLTPLPTTRDQQVSLDFIDVEVVKNRHFVIFWIAEASNLEHDLGMALFLHRLHYPVYLVLNMMDEAVRNGLSIDLKKIEQATGMPVLATSARDDRGVEALKQAMGRECVSSHPAPPRILEALAPADIFALQSDASQASRVIAAQAVGGLGAGEILPKVRQAMALDRFLFHPIAGPFLFMLIMGLMFNAIFSWAAPITDVISAGIDALRAWTLAHVPWPQLASLIANGILAGVGAVIVFIPQIGILFLLIGALEKSGYLPRAAVLMDRLMRPFGLDGRVFVPLLSSFACAIPGIMATRTLESEKRRITTILLAPLMTCSARLPVYTLIISAFVPAAWRVAGFSGQGLVMVAMYFLAIAFAMLVAFVLKQTALHVPGGSQFMILPPFRLPRIKELIKFTGQRCIIFLKRAGKVIFVVSIILWFLASYPKLSLINDITLTPESAAAMQIEQSYLGHMGKVIQPIFAPLGYDWKLSVAILSAFAAREVFVGTLGTIYALGNADANSQGLVANLQEARAADGTPLYTVATAVSLLILFAIALQCISTIAITHRETGGWKWPIVQVGYLWAMAYLFAFIGYRIALLLFF